MYILLAGVQDDGVVVFQNPGGLKGVMQKVNPFKSSTQVSVHFNMRSPANLFIIRCNLRSHSSAKN